MKNDTRTMRSQKMQYTYEFKIRRSQELLEFLYERVHLSRNTVKGLLSSHKVLVNGKVVTQFNYPLAKDDEVKISKTSVKVEPIKKERKHVKSAFEKMIIYEDDTYLAINKPYGLLSVENGNEKECAYAMAVDYLSQNGATSRPYILHRIDRDTSGVLVFAKDIKAHSMLKSHWNQDMRLREYYAVVCGQLEQKEGTVINYLMENKNNMVFVSRDTHGKKSITSYEVIKENKEYSLVRVWIDTGRKNQIRVTFADMGHPIVGDDKYGNGVNPLDRLGLHASRLYFIDPLTRNEMKLNARYPEEFNTLVKGK